MDSDSSSSRWATSSFWTRSNFSLSRWTWRTAAHLVSWLRVVRGDWIGIILFLLYVFSLIRILFMCVFLWFIFRIFLIVCLSVTAKWLAATYTVGIKLCSINQSKVLPGSYSTQLSATSGWAHSTILSIENFYNTLNEWLTALRWRLRACTRSAVTVRQTNMNFFYYFNLMLFFTCFYRAQYSRFDQRALCGWS